MLDLELWVIATKNIWQGVDGEEVDCRRDDGVDMCLAREVEDVQRVHVWVGEITDEWRLHRSLDKPVVALQRMWPCFQEMLDGLPSQIRNEVFCRQSEDARDVVEIL